MNHLENLEDYISALISWLNYWFLSW